MFYNQKEVIQWSILIAIYSLFGLMGGYEPMFILLFPLLATPLTLFLMANRRSVIRDLIMHGIIVLIIVLTTQSIQQAMMYGIVVVLPSHLMSYMYRKAYTIPHMIMYIGTGVVGAFYLYLAVMKFLGVDYIAYYMEAVSAYKEMLLTSLKDITQATEQTIDATQMVQMKEMINMNIIILQTLYPTLFLVVGIILGTVYSMVITVAGRIKKWRMQPIAQITQFTFSRYIIILLVISVLLANMGIESNQLITLGVNLQVFIIYLLEILGMISLLILISRSKWGQGRKIFATISVILLMGIFPQLLMIAGFTDVVFNFRKVKIII